MLRRLPAHRSNRGLTTILAAQEVRMDVKAMKSWVPTPDQSNALFAELGRCLYLYQSIEVSLKLLLPHFVVPGTDSHAKNEGFANWHVFIDNKETLGPLIQRLKDRVTSDQRVELEADWTRLVAHRNEVVHQFASQPFARLSSEEQYAAAMKFLYERRQHAIPMYDMLQALLAAFLEALKPPDSSTESSSVHYSRSV